MGALVENSFRLAHQALCQRDVRAAEPIAAIDWKIDRFYRDIESECAELMAIASPVAQDLRLLTAFMQMTRDLEVIGDLAGELGEIARKLFPYPEHPCLPVIGMMSDRAREMLGSSLAALADLDGDAGAVIEGLDDEVDRLYQEIYEDLVYQPNISGAVEPIVLLSFAIYHLERIADLSTNIAHRITFIVTGQNQVSRKSSFS
jgi:phosphate transport system protein